MRRSLVLLAIPLIFLLVLWVESQAPRAGYTRLELDAGTGRKIFYGVLADGDPIVFKWRNSLFGLDVTEVYVARDGGIIQTEVTFADPRGVPPMPIRAEEVDEYYHTGGPFTAKGLNRRFTRIVYRVGEIGNPKMTIADRVVEFKSEVGFGGAVVLTTAEANWWETVIK